MDARGGRGPGTGDRGGEGEPPDRGGRVICLTTGSCFVRLDFQSLPTRYTFAKGEIMSTQK